MIVRIATLVLARAYSWEYAHSVISVRRRCAVPGDAFARDKEKWVPRPLFSETSIDYPNSGLPLSY
jgi:hypothetical protein